MPSLERKSLDRLQKGDRLLTDAGVFSRAGLPIDEKTIRILARQRVPWIPVIQPTYEEKDLLERKGFSEDQFIEKQLNRYASDFSSLQYRLLEKLKSIYTPYHESEKGFQARGKKKQITDDLLMDKNPGPLYREDILSGSRGICSENDIRYLKEGLQGAQGTLDRLTRREKDTAKQKKRIPLITPCSIRLQSYYDDKRLSTVGDALPWHVLETAFSFLLTMTNINKKRIVQGYPLSETRFDPDNHSGQTDTFQYRSDTILQAALGILFYALGFSHKSIHSIISGRPILERETRQGVRTIRTLQKAYWVGRNRLSEREDIPPISRMMVNLQSDFPDGTGFPPPNRNPFLHEFVRLFHIIRFYDALTNPVLQGLSFSRMAVIDYMRRNSSPYEYHPGEFIPQGRFDSGLLQEFLSLLAPWHPGEKVYLYPRNNRSNCFFVGRVYSYLEPPIPLVSILRDERSGKTYPYGRMLLHIPSSSVIMMEGKKIRKKIKQDWIGKLEIFDRAQGAAEITDFTDLILGKERPLARQLRS